MLDVHNDTWYTFASLRVDGVDIAPVDGEAPPTFRARGWHPDKRRIRRGSTTRDLLGLYFGLGGLRRAGSIQGWPLRPGLRTPTSQAWTMLFWLVSPTATYHNHTLSGIRAQAGTLRSVIEAGP